MVQGLERDRPVGRFLQGLGHHLGAEGRHGGQARRRRADRDQTRPRSKRRRRGQACRSGLPARAGDDQHAAVVALVRIGGPRLDERAHAVSGEPFHPRAGDGLDHRTWDADFGDDQMACQRLSGGKHQRQLGRRERHGQAGPYGRSGNFVTIGRQAAGQVDRHDGRRRAVQVGDHGLDPARERALQPRPEQRVDDDVGAGDGRCRAVPRRAHR